MKPPLFFLFGGTTESRKIYSYLNDREIPTLVSVTRPSASELYKPLRPIQLNVSKLSTNSLNRLLDRFQPDGIIDATHPFASKISELLTNTCRSRPIPLVGWKRPSFLENLNGNLSNFKDYLTILSCFDEIPDRIGTLTDPYLITTGTESLEHYTPLDNPNQAFIRILPRDRALARARVAGFLPRNTIALWPPVGRDQETAFINQHNIRYLITKDSGPAGGLNNKLSACRETGAKLWVIRRPKNPVPETVGDLDQLDNWVEALD